MQITSILAGLDKSAATTPNRTNIAGDFDRFLTLLTTQLQNQDPMAPLDATQFTNQLVQFSQVEQTVNMNSRLGDLLAIQEKGRVDGAVAYIGRSVDALSSTAPLQGGSADLFYAVDGEPKKVALNILDQSGRLVRTLAGSTGTGIQRVTWDGKDAAGNAAKDGVYQIQLVARDGSDKALPGQTGFTGRVDAVAGADGELVLAAGGVSVKMSEIVAVRQPAATGKS